MAREKIRLLELIDSTERFSAQDLQRLLGTLCYLHAYPDSATVLAKVRSLAGRLRDWEQRTRRGGDCAGALIDIGFPGGTNYYGYALPVLVRMLRSFPDCFGIDWDEFEENGLLQNRLGIFVAPAELGGLDSTGLSSEEWATTAKRADQTCLEFFVELFTGSDLGYVALENLWDSAEIPLRYDLRREGTGRSEIFWPVDRVRYQKGPLENERIALAPAIRKVPKVDGPLDPEAGQAFIDFALTSLCARNLEIRTLMYASPHDVHLVDCGRGLQIALIGVVPSYRDALECNYCCLMVKNGIAMAYGPASVHYGRCEMGLNLFPEYRHGEIRWIYPQYMRAIHHVLGAKFFFLESYGMGDGNPDAIRSGAFWFYRKLGFSAAEPEVEALAQEEESKIAQQRGYRSGRKTLLRLAKTEAYFDMSGGGTERFDLAAIGLGVTQMINEKFAGERKAAELACTRRVARQLDITKKSDEGTLRALRFFAPILCTIEGFAGWSAADNKLMRQIIQAKGGKSEALVDRMLCGHASLRLALRVFNSGE